MSHPGPSAVEIKLADAERARLAGVSVESSRVAIRARIRRYIAWRNRNIADPRLRRIVKRANVA
jgi:hypothetical protein